MKLFLLHTPTLSQKKQTKKTIKTLMSKVAILAALTGICGRAEFNHKVLRASWSAAQELNMWRAVSCTFLLESLSLTVLDLYWKSYLLTLQIGHVTWCKYTVTNGSNNTTRDIQFTLIEYKSSWCSHSRSANRWIFDIFHLKISI